MTRLPTPVVHRHDLSELGVREDRLIELKPMRVLRGSSSRFRSGPMYAERLMMMSSRILSMGGLVTCAKSCLK